MRGPAAIAKPLRRIRKRPRLRRTALFGFLAVMGPGLITGFAGNDAGGVATYTAVGARYGYTLLWLLVVAFFGLILVQEMCARMGAVTGKGLSDLIRERFGVRWTIIAMAALLVANGANVAAEYAGIAASLELIGVDRLISVPLAGVVVWAVVVFFSYRIVERVLIVLILAFVAYPVTAFLVGPRWSDVAGSFAPPTVPLEQAAIVMSLAIVGTTIAPFMPFYVQASVVDKGIDRESFGNARIDAFLGAFLGGIIALFIVILAGAVLHPAGVDVETAEEAARALGPLAGDRAALLFAMGLLGASLLAATVLPLSTSYAICEAFGWESGISKRFSEAPVFMGLFTFLLVAGALVVLIPGMPLIQLILVSQNVQGLLLPIVLVFILKLATDRKLMGNDVNGRFTTVAGWGIAALASTLSLALVALTLFG